MHMTTIPPCSYHHTTTTKSTTTATIISTTTTATITTTTTTTTYSLSILGLLERRFYTLFIGNVDGKNRIWHFVTIDCIYNLNKNLKLGQKVIGFKTNSIT